MNLTKANFDNVMNKKIKGKMMDGSNNYRYCFFDKNSFNYCFLTAS